MEFDKTTQDALKLIHEGNHIIFREVGRVCEKYHLNYFLDSLDRSENENKSLMEIEKQVRLTYPLAYRIGSDIYDIVTREVGVESYKCEKVFLVLHIQRLL